MYINRQVITDNVKFKFNGIGIIKRGDRDRDGHKAGAAPRAADLCEYKPTSSPVFKQFSDVRIRNLSVVIYLYIILPHPALITPVFSEFRSNFKLAYTLLKLDFS
ncbi:unnamed protein product [Colias eurytheme]|nr:unnamed protein product [Colias eurytheme]